MGQCWRDKATNNWRVKELRKMYDAPYSAIRKHLKDNHWIFCKASSSLRKVYERRSKNV